MKESMTTEQVIQELQAIAQEYENGNDCSNHDVHGCVIVAADQLTAKDAEIARLTEENNDRRKHEEIQSALLSAYRKQGFEPWMPRKAKLLRQQNLDLLKKIQRLTESLAESQRREQAAVDALKNVAEGAAACSYCANRKGWSTCSVCEFVYSGPVAGEGE